MRPSVLPHRPEAENAVLGGVLLRGKESLSEALTLITDEDFYQPRAQAVFRAMRILDEQGQSIDPVTLETQLRKTGELELVGGIEALARLDRYANAHNIRAHAELVAEAAQVRRVVVACRELAEEGMGELEDAAEFIDKAEASLFAIRSKSRKGGPKHVRDMMTVLFTDITSRGKQEGGVTGISTPWPLLNEMTAGLHEAEMTILAARPSVGKTALSLDIAAHASSTAQKHARTIEAAAPDHGGDYHRAYLDLVARKAIPHRVPTLFFSLEMAEQQLLERVLCSEARVDAQKVRKGGKGMQVSEFEALISAADRLSKHSDLYIDDRTPLTISEIRATARLWAAQHLRPLDPDDPASKRPGLIMIDYLQLALGTKGLPREQQVAEISRGLKAMAKELKVPVIALAQLNRSVDSRAGHRPQLSDLRESGSIEQDADVIMFIHREDRYSEDTAAGEQVEAPTELIIGKQRNGPIGSVPLVFIKRHTRFESRTLDDYGQS